MGDKVDTEHTPLPSRSLLSPRWTDPFLVLVLAAPNTYRLNIPGTRDVDVLPKFNVERLCPSGLSTTTLQPQSLSGDSDAGPP